MHPNKPLLLNSQLRAPEPKIAAAIKSFVVSSGYTQTRLQELGLTKTPWRRSHDRSLLSYHLDEASPLGLLIRLFFFGEPVPATALSPLVVKDMLASGMLQRSGEELLADCMLTHFEKLLIACDSVRRVQAGVLEDLVLGVNRPTQILGHCMLPVAAGSAVLDLGTGCGSLALKAAQTAARVVGTDINLRALQFAEFNAWLNGISNVEFRCGDRFEPVSGERFDIIVSNPPFFLTPKSKLLFTDNPFHLDHFAETLARLAPHFLSKSGYFQMLCEWVETKDDPDRLRRWFDHSNCEVLVLEDYSVTPASYSLSRTAEAAALHGGSAPASISDYMQYFADAGVEKIHGGLVTVRLGQTQWFVMEEMGEKPSAPIGDLLLERFSAEDLLTSNDDAQLLTAYPQLARDVVLVSESSPENLRWKPTRVYLERRSALSRRLAFSSEIADIVAQWDGSQDLASLASVFARNKHLPAQQVAQDFLRLARRLASLSLIRLNASKPGLQVRRPI